MTGAYTVGFSENRVKGYVPGPDYSVDDEVRFPDVPTNPAVDLEALLKVWDDSDPLYVTRPLAILGESSRNGLHYNQAIFDDIYQQVLGKRPVSRRGHIAKEDKASSFPPEEAYWIGVVIDSTAYGKPTVFGKAYIARGLPLHDMVRSRKATKTAISNSIWGDVFFDPNGEPIGVEIESIDFVPEERAALQALGGSFKVTSEMQEESMADDKGDEKAQFKQKCAEMMPEELAEMLTGEQRRHVAEAYMKECGPDKAYESLHETVRKHVAEARMKEMSGDQTYATLSEATRKSVAEAYCRESGMKMVKEADTAQVQAQLAEMTSVKSEAAQFKVQLAEMQGVIKQYQREDYERALVETVDGYFADWNVVTAPGKEKLNALKANLRVLTVSEMAGSTKPEDIAPAATKAWENVKPLAEMTRAALAGPSAFVGVTAVNGGGPNRFGYDPTTGRYSDESVRNATRMTGVLGGRSGGGK